MANHRPHCEAHHTKGQINSYLSALIGVNQRQVFLFFSASPRLRGENTLRGKVSDMSTVRVNGVNLFYKESGNGPETIVFSHGLLMDHTMFELQRAAFEKQYRVIAYDHRAQ